MKVLAFAFLVVTLASIASASASAASTQAGAERWRVIGRGTDAGDGIAVAAAAKRRTSRLAVRVRVTGRPKRAQMHTVVTCSKAGFGIYSRRDTFVLWPSAVRMLRLPIGYPENCGVTAIGVIHPVSRRAVITVEILAVCSVQRNGICF